MLRQNKPVALLGVFHALGVVVTTLTRSSLSRAIAGNSHQRTANNAPYAYKTVLITRI
jgi:hypothetical protein